MNAPVDYDALLAQLAPHLWKGSSNSPLLDGEDPLGNWGRRKSG